MITCRHCDRRILQDMDGVWCDPEAGYDDEFGDGIWRETCDANDTFDAKHEPAEQDDPYEQDRMDKAREAASSLRALYDPMSGRIDNWSER